MSFQMGDTVKDTVTGYTGTVVSFHRYFNGCEQYGLAAKLGKDGKPPATEHFDHQRLILVKANAIQPISSATGGPQRDAPRG